MLDRHLFFPWLFLSALAATGCGGPDFEAICDEQEICAGGNEKDREACVVAFEGFAEVADDIGCADEFDAYFLCSQENASCRDLPTGDTCMADNDCNGPGNARCSGVDRRLGRQCGPWVRVVAHDGRDVDGSRGRGNRC